MRYWVVTLLAIFLVSSAYAESKVYGNSIDDGGNIISTEQETAGDNSYAIKDTAIAGTSQNFAFGFTSQIVAIETPTTNTDEVCIDWIGGTAVCPSADTAGDDRLQPGTTIIVDFMGVTSVSAIANSGTQTVYIRAWD